MTSERIKRDWPELHPSWPDFDSQDLFYVFRDADLFARDDLERAIKLGNVTDQDSVIGFFVSRLCYHYKMGHRIPKAKGEFDGDR